MRRRAPCPGRVRVQIQNDHPQLVDVVHVVRRLFIYKNGILTSYKPIYLRNPVQSREEGNKQNAKNRGKRRETQYRYVEGFAIDPSNNTTKKQWSQSLASHSHWCKEIDTPHMIIGQPGVGRGQTPDWFWLSYFAIIYYLWNINKRTKQNHYIFC